MSWEWNWSRSYSECSQTLMDYAQPSLVRMKSCIIRPTIESIVFELKPFLCHYDSEFSLVPWITSEDPNLHIANFLEIYDMFRANGASDNAKRLRLFLFSQRDKEKIWLNSLPAGSIHDWNTLARKSFLIIFHPQRLSNCVMILQFFCNLRMRHCMKLGKGIKICLRSVHIMGYQIGCKFRQFTMV